MMFKLMELFCRRLSEMRLWLNGWTLLIFFCDAGSINIFRDTCSTTFLGKERYIRSFI